jgi:hypothetical protein
MADSDAPRSALRTAVEGVADCELDDAYDAADPPPGEGTRGGHMLVDLADVLRRAGVAVEEVDGWQHRSRGGAGFPASGPVAIIIHHTASGRGGDGRGDVQFMTFDCAVKPMANLYLDRSGRWWVCAAGATNTNGKGGPLGPLPRHSANSRVLGIEAGNDGVGEPWPDVMQDSYVAGVAALATAYRIDGAHVYAHHEWAPGRKVDPAGPSRFGAVNAHASWDMGRFRAAVAARRAAPATAAVAPVPPAAPVAAPTPPPPRAAPAPPAPSRPTGATYVVRPNDSWWSIAAAVLGDPARTWVGLARANGGAERVLHPGDVLALPATAARPAAVAGVPPFPGEARQGHRGGVVSAWQQALIAAGVIRDTGGNRDGYYGPGLAGAVRRLQASWGWSDADGVAGPHTWSRLHGGP